jgi:hypothetical protein
MIREVNKVKRLTWAMENQDDDFDDVIWSDECTVQLETTGDFVAEKSVMHPSQNPSTQVL